MRLKMAVWLGCVLAAHSCAGLALAQTQPLPPATQDALHAMSRRAGVIFAGQVVAVRLHEGTAGATGVIEIDFAVEDAVRGVGGATYTLREWAGLAPSSEQPFRVGQRFLMLLHPPGAAGLSSPVGGADGAIPIRASGVAPTPAVDSEAKAFPAQTDGRAVDLRWVETRVIRPASLLPRPVARPTALPVPAHAAAAIAGSALAQNSAPVSMSPSPSAASRSGDGSVAHSAAYASVLAILRSWERDDDAGR